MIVQTSKGFAFSISRAAAAMAIRFADTVNRERHMDEMVPALYSARDSKNQRIVLAFGAWPRAQMGDFECFDLDGRLFGVVLDPEARSLVANNLIFVGSAGLNVRRATS